MQPFNDKPAAENLAEDLLHKMDAYWRAANYLSVGQIYLHDNPLLREPLQPEHIKKMLLELKSDKEKWESIFFDDAIKNEDD